MKEKFRSYLIIRIGLSVITLLCYSIAWAQNPILVTPVGHTGLVTCVEFSSDGKYVLTGSADGTAKLWDRQGYELNTFEIHPSGVTTAKFSPDNQHLLIGSFDGTINEYSIDGDLIKTLASGTYSGSKVAYSPNGKQMLTMTSNGMLFDTGSGKVSFFPKEETWSRSGISSIVFSPNGKQVLSNSLRDSSAVLWSLEGEVLQIFKGHKDVVKSVAFSPDGNIVLTGSADGVIKLWNLSGTVIQSIQGHKDGVLSVAFSPTADQFVSTSQTEAAKLWDLDGTLLRVFTDFEGVEERSIAFSPDGNQLLYASGNKAMLRTLTGDIVQSFQGYIRQPKDFKISRDQKLLWQDGDESLKLFDLIAPRATQTIEVDGKIRSFDFSADEKVVLLTLEKGFATLNLDSEKLKYIDQSGEDLKSITFSENGKKAISESINGTIMVWDLTAETSFILNLKKETLAQVHFSPKENYLIGQSQQLDWKIWNLKGKEIFKLSGKSDSIDFFRVSPDESLMLTHARSGILKIWNKEEQILAELPSMEGKLRSAAFSLDNQFLLIVNEAGTLTLFNLIKKETVFSRNSWGYEFRDERIPPSARFSPDYQSIIYCVSDRILQYDLDGNIRYDLETGSPESISSLEFSPDKQYFSSLNTIGIGGSILALWTADGRQVRSFEESIYNRFQWGFTGDSRTFVTSVDNELDFWAIETGKSLGRLLLVNEEDWIITESSGLFDASPGAMRYMHYVVFYEGAYEVVELEQLKARYYEPGLLQMTLGISEEIPRPVEEFEDLPLFPKVEAIIQNDSLLIQLKERNGGIGRVSIFINGKEVEEDANPLPRRENAKRKSAIRYDLKQHRNYLLQHPDSTNVISIRAYNEEAWLKSQAINLEYKVTSRNVKGENNNEGNDNWEAQLDPKLYVISIGTSDYAGTKLDLQYADQDAALMAQALAALGATLFNNGDSIEVHAFTTTNTDSTALKNTDIEWQYADKKNIETAFKEIRKKAKAEDIIVVYLSGHGLTYGSAEQALFHYLTSGIASEDLSDMAIRRAYTISSDELTQWINDIPALKQVLIIDACNSGQIIENISSGTKSINSSQIRALDRMKDRTGMFVLSGSAADKVSYEASEYGQGLLTYALLQGMLGTAVRKTADGNYVDVMKLFQYVSDEVPRLATSINGIQTPMLGFPNKGRSFDIGILNEAVKIPIGNKKPVITRSIFLNQKTLQDDLDLVGKLETAFRKETEKGKDADLIYVDVPNYPGAYSLSGLYEISSNEIQLNIKLFDSEGKAIALSIPATDDPDRLVKLIMRAIKKTLP